jgi:hypothetical protein
METPRIRFVNPQSKVSERCPLGETEVIDILDICSRCGLYGEADDFLAAVKVAFNGFAAGFTGRSLAMLLEKMPL